MHDVIEFETKIEDSPRDYAAKISIISYQLAALEMETNSQYTIFLDMLEEMEGGEDSKLIEKAIEKIKEIMGEESKHNRIFKEIADRFADVREEE